MRLEALNEASVARKVTVMELNGDDSDNKPRESRSKPFDIDLNETPLPSPRETSVAGAAADVSSAPVPASNSGHGNRVRDGGFDLLDINASPPCEEESSEYISGRTNLNRLQGKRKGDEWSQDPFMKKASFKFPYKPEILGFRCWPTLKKMPLRTVLASKTEPVAAEGERGASAIDSPTHIPLPAVEACDRRTPTKQKLQPSASEALQYPTGATSPPGKARYKRKDLCAAFGIIVIPAPLHPGSPTPPADDETEGQLQHGYKRQRVEIEHVCLSEAGSGSAATISGSGVLSSEPATTALPFVPSPLTPASSPPASASKSPASKSPPAAYTLPLTDAPSLSLPWPSLPSSFARFFPELPSISPAYPSVPAFDFGEFQGLLESVRSLVSSPLAQQGLASLLQDPTLSSGILQFCKVSAICAAKQLKASESHLQNIQDKFTEASEALELLKKELDNEAAARKKDLFILAATQSELSAAKERLASMESENRRLRQHNETLHADLSLTLRETDRLRAEISKTWQDLATSREEQDSYFGLHSSLCTKASGFDKPGVIQVYQRKGRQ